MARVTSRGIVIVILAGADNAAISVSILLLTAWKKDKPQTGIKAAFRRSLLQEAARNTATPPWKGC